MVGFLRASGYFTLRPFLDSIHKVRILIGIDVDKYIARAHQKGELFFGAEDEVKEECLRMLKQDIEQSHYAKKVEDGMLQMVQDMIDGKLELRAHPSKKIHAKLYILYPDNFNQHTFGTAITGSSNLIDNQHAMAEVLGVEVDESCKDASRMSFICKESDILFLDKELFTYENPAYGEKYNEAYRKGFSAAESHGQTRTNNGKVSVSPLSSAAKNEENLSYHGIEYEKICEVWQAAQGGVPATGDCHRTMLLLGPKAMLLILRYLRMLDGEGHTFL